MARAGPISFRRSATYVHKILQGTRPSDLPVEQPTKLDLVLNLKAATTLGLTFPQTLLATADEVSAPCRSLTSPGKRR
jgi:putative ABC transport system substrate-binding protein